MKRLGLAFTAFWYVLRGWTFVHQIKVFGFIRVEERSYVSSVDIDGLGGCYAVGIGKVELPTELTPEQWRYFQEDDEQQFGHGGYTGRGHIGSMYSEVDV